MFTLNDVLTDIKSAPNIYWTNALKLANNKAFNKARNEFYSFVATASKENNTLWTTWDYAYSYTDMLSTLRRSLALTTIRAFALRHIMDAELFNILTEPWRKGFERDSDD